MDAVGKALDLKRRGRLEEAESILRSELASYTDDEGHLPGPGQAGHKHGLAVAASLADTLVRRGRLEEAEAMVDSILAQSPMDRRAMVVKGNIRLGQERFGEAAEYLEAALRARADQYAVKRLALAFYRSDDTEALERLSRTEGRDNAAVFTYLGLLAEKEGSASEGIAYFQKALELDPNNSFAYSRLLGLKAMDRPTEEVTRDLGQIIKIKGADAQLLATRAQKHRRAGNYLEAARDFVQAANLQPANPFFWAQAGFAFIRAEKREEAIPMLEEGLKLSPADNMIGKALVKSYLETGEGERGVGFLEALIASSGQRRLYGLLKLLTRDQDGGQVRT